MLRIEFNDMIQKILRFYGLKFRIICKGLFCLKGSNEIEMIGMF